MQGSQVVLAWHSGRFFVPALDFRACTHARMHTPLFAVMVSCMQYLYSNIPVWRLRNDRHCNCGGRSAIACSPALVFFYFCTVPVGYHPRLVRTAGNSATLQKWRKHASFFRCAGRCTIGRFWLRTPAGGSAQLRSEPTELSLCSQGSSSVPASAMPQGIGCGGLLLQQASKACLGAPVFVLPWEVRGCAWVVVVSCVCVLAASPPPPSAHAMLWWRGGGRRPCWWPPSPLARLSSCALL